MIDVNSAVRASEQLSIIANKISTTTDIFFEHIELVSKALNSLGITVKDSLGRFRNFGDVYQEAYDNAKKAKDCNKKNVEPIGPVSIEKIEISKEKEFFDFLEQNAYDHIEPFFNSDIKHIKLLDNT